VVIYFCEKLPVFPALSDETAACYSVLSQFTHLCYRHDMPKTKTNNQNIKKREKMTKPIHKTTLKSVFNQAKVSHEKSNPQKIKN
jgi:hypothetical protein